MPAVRRRKARLLAPRGAPVHQVVTDMAHEEFEYRVAILAGQGLRQTMHCLSSRRALSRQDLVVCRDDLAAAVVQELQRLPDAAFRDRYHRGIAAGYAEIGECRAQGAIIQRRKLKRQAP
ncbi:hypothetical protein AJ87_12450 [Rhizobium yanglingense]|nr:hypothetical protein AJ87_12450 [Rhizobium yanglingense]